VTSNIAADLARRQILAVAEAALLKAGVAGVIPTPLDVVAAAAEITEIIDISQLPADIAARKPRAMLRILGALLHREQVVFVDMGQCEPRARLTEAHEIAHQIIPWHQAAFQLDDRERLLGNTRDQLETEAYLAGGHLIFQGQRFMRPALDYQVSISTPIALAPDFGASRHATIRYYVLHHPDAVALLVAGRYPYRDGSVPIWTSVESASFAQKYGRLADIMGGRLLVASGGGKPLGDIAHEAMTTAEVAAKDLLISDLRGDRRDFVAEAFYNQHNVLIMVAERKAVRFGRRIRIAAS
jgi:hypothetical protein